MEFKPYRSVSKYALERLREGATIVDLLTDWKTPCYIYQLKKEKINGRDIDFNEIIAVNNGVDTYAETSNVTHIFKNRQKDNFTIFPLLERKVILNGDLPVSLHIEKQLSQPFFSTFSIRGEIEEIINDFLKEGYEIISLANVEYISFMNTFCEVTNKNREKIQLLREEARLFYKSQSKLLSL